ncbi:MAG: methyltransferase domain-containing protein [Nanoarchaeota archaeon]|nr:methyltransferase domain-containing protein [Nanoarchaeota archaeon]MBU1103330.1 methyltransferase domain-containing protein [Nanoarchaeota archaeon]
MPSQTTAIKSLKKKKYLTEEESKEYAKLMNSVYNRIFLKEIIDCWQKALKAICAKKGEKILNVGDSGLVTAKQIFTLYPKLENLTTIDIITNRYKSAIKTSAESIKNKIGFKVMDARKMKFKNKSFDKVIATNNINEIEGNWKKAVNEMIRVLKPAGDLILTEHRLNYKLSDDRLFSIVFLPLSEMHANDIMLDEICTFSKKLKVIKKYKNKRGWFVHFKKT